MMEGIKKGGEKSVGWETDLLGWVLYISNIALPVIGIPQKPCTCLISLTSATVWVGDKTVGSMINPFSNFLTLRTMSACSSAEQLLWRIPMPPKSFAGKERELSNSCKCTLLLLWTYSHWDCHIGFSYSIHRRGQEGGAQGDVLGDLGFQTRSIGSEVNVARKNQKVIVGQPSAQLFIQQSFDRQTITMFVLFQSRKGISRSKERHKCLIKDGFIKKGGWFFKRGLPPPSDSLKHRRPSFIEKVDRVPSHLSYCFFIGCRGRWCDTLISGLDFSRSSFARVAQKPVMTHWLIFLSTPTDWATSGLSLNVRMRGSLLHQGLC